MKQVLSLNYLSFYIHAETALDVRTMKDYSYSPEIHIDLYCDLYQYTRKYRFDLHVLICVA